MAPLQLYSYYPTSKTLSLVLALMLVGRADHFRASCQQASLSKSSIWWLMWPFICWTLSAIVVLIMFASLRSPINLLLINNHNNDINALPLKLSWNPYVWYRLLSYSPQLLIALQQSIALVPWASNIVCFPRMFTASIAVCDRAWTSIPLYIGSQCMYLLTIFLRFFLLGDHEPSTSTLHWPSFTPGWMLGWLLCMHMGNIAFYQYMKREKGIAQTANVFDYHL